MAYESRSVLTFSGRGQVCFIDIDNRESLILLKNIKTCFILMEILHDLTLKVRRICNGKDASNRCSGKQCQPKQQ